MTVVLALFLLLLSKTEPENGSLLFVAFLVSQQSTLDATAPTTSPQIGLCAIPCRNYRRRHALRWRQALEPTSTQTGLKEHARLPIPTARVLRNTWYLVGVIDQLTNQIARFLAVSCVVSRVSTIPRGDRISLTFDFFGGMPSEHSRSAGNRLHRCVALRG